MGLNESGDRGEALELQEGEGPVGWQRMCVP